MHSEHRQAGKRAGWTNSLHFKLLWFSDLGSRLRTREQVGDSPQARGLSVAVRLAPSRVSEKAIPRALPPPPSGARLHLANQGEARAAGELSGAWRPDPAQSAEPLENQGASVSARPWFSRASAVSPAQLTRCTRRDLRGDGAGSGRRPDGGGGNLRFPSTACSDFAYRAFSPVCRGLCRPCGSYRTRSILDIATCSIGASRLGHLLSGIEQRLTSFIYKCAALHTGHPRRDRAMYGRCEAPRARRPGH